MLIVNVNEGNTGFHCIILNCTFLIFCKVKNSEERKIFKDSPNCAGFEHDLRLSGSDGPYRNTKIKEKYFQLKMENFQNWVIYI